jgi:DNA mismatch repair protein MutL
VIRLLPREVAERIAAGEVIERPAAVVRELLDNALDAGATEIRVEIAGGGLELIRVSDDGRGIPADQVELAFQRHATSKIRSTDDLLSLSTLGFRGEALPSIAAISDVTMLTQDDTAEVGTRLSVRAGDVTAIGRVARQRGTTVAVQHLFRNVPARLKFLTGGRAESLSIGQLVRRYALAHPAVRFALAVDSRPSFRSSGSGELRAVLAEIYGPMVAATLLPLRGSQSDVARLEGLLSGRAVTRPGRQHLTVVVNGRWATSAGLTASLEAAYRPLLPRGRHPLGVLILNVPPAELDANVHPAKSEVRLLREPEVCELVSAAVRETLGRAVATPGQDDDFSLSDFQYGLPSPRRRIAEAPGGFWRGRADAERDAGLLERPSDIAELVALTQAHQSLIVAEGPSGVYLVDQHRAHERIIFEALQGQSPTPGMGQSLLEPLLVELKPSDAALLEQRLPELETLGFQCQRFGDREFLIRTVPAGTTIGGLADDLAAMLEVAATAGEDWRDRLLAALACRGAIRRHRPLEMAEMRRLLVGLSETEAPAACPHGSPVLLYLGARFLERQFNW